MAFKALTFVACFCFNFQIIISVSNLNPRITEATVHLTRRMRRAVKESEEGTSDSDIDCLAEPVKESENHGLGAGSSCETRLQILLNENQSLKRENSNLEKLVKESERFCQERESKLKSTLKSVENFKENMMAGRKDGKKNESSENLRKVITALKAKVKDYEKQKKDLLLGFKKQIQLIDILKRQKVHLQASRQLNCQGKKGSL
jgi:hypothetical protein